MHWTEAQTIQEKKSIVQDALLRKEMKFYVESPILHWNALQKQGEIIAK